MLAACAGADQSDRVRSTTPTARGRLISRAARRAGYERHREARSGRFLSRAMECAYRRKIDTAPSPGGSGGAAASAENLSIGTVGREHIPLFNPRVNVYQLRPGKRA